MFTGVPGLEGDDNNSVEEVNKLFAEVEVNFEAVGVLTSRLN